MTEVPEHLLRRSRERREALGLAPVGSGGEAPAAPPAEAAEAAEEAPTPAEETGAAVATAEAAAPVPAAEAPPAAPAIPAYVAAAAARRTGIPVWMVPVLAILPIWAVLYYVSFESHTRAVALTPLQLGAQVFSQSCSPCHGAKGEGGVGPKLAGGEAKLTFPNQADHIAWVETGSGPHKGQPYGDPNRAGGQHVAKTGGMPPFKGQLTDAQIQAVVTYERDGLP